MSRPSMYMGLIQVQVEVVGVKAIAAKIDPWPVHISLPVLLVLVAAVEFSEMAKYNRCHDVIVDGYHSKFWVQICA